MNIRLAGSPAPQVVDAVGASTVFVYPLEFPGIKPRLRVKEGDTVKRGSVLFYDKVTEALQFRSPAAGTIASIVYGPRRSIQEIRIDVAASDETEAFEKYDASRIASLSRDEVLAHLQETGLLAFVRERPFSRIADPAVTPKSIFVNAMNTAPFQPEFAVVLKGDEAAFQAGLDVLGRLTEGQVHLCLPPMAPEAATNASNVQTHTFTGPHPSGNTSVHIHNIDAISPGQQVWTAKAVDVIQIGKLFLEGAVPGTKVISLAGPGVKEEARRYYRVRVGSNLDAVLKNNLEEGEQRVVSGDALSGTQIVPEGGIRALDSSIVVLPEGRDRTFLGWMAPGMDRYSHSRLFLSSWFKRGAEWALNTNKNGSDRAMVVTGVYDRFLPMNIRVDYLVRAVLAHDTEEAVQLGLLETDPEDFALCSFACVSKMDLVGIIRKGLLEVAEEGL